MISSDDHVTLEFPSPFYSYQIGYFGWVFEFSN